MSVCFSRYIFFLWYLFTRDVNILSEEKNTLLIKTEIKELKLTTSNNIKAYFLIIKYLPVVLLMVLSISLKELQNLDLIIILAPLYMILNFLFFNYKRILIPISILSATSIFIFYDILLFPIFIKYLIISYIFIEFYFDYARRKQFYVYENNQEKKPVAFAVIQKRSIY